jgi:hypothetical protein
MAADRHALAAQLDIARHENAAQQTQIDRLQRRVGELSSRRAIRMANSFGRLMQALAEPEHPQPSAGPLVLAPGRSR